MANSAPEQKIQEFLKGRYIATLGTLNADASVHLTAVWYLFEGSHLFVSTSFASRKAHNVAARSKASLMVDVRKPGSERGAAASGTADIITGEQSQEINRRIHRRYMSEAALADSRIGPVLAAVDDVTIRLKPNSWISWDMAAMDAQVFGGLLGGTPGYLLPID